jgi:membrane-associated phospholipid phosphatase
MFSHVVSLPVPRAGLILATCHFPVRFWCNLYMKGIQFSEGRRLLMSICRIRGLRSSVVPLRRKLRLGNVGIFLLLIVLGKCGHAFAQSSTYTSPDQIVDTKPAPTEPESASQERQVSWKLLAPNIARDQKRIWLFPAQVAHGRHWKPTAAFLVATAGLVALDPHDAPYFRNTHSFDGFNRKFSGGNSSLGMTLFPLAWYAAGLARKNSYAQHTSLLAGEAVADAEILTTILKDLDRRLRPIEVPPNGNYSDTWFEGHGPILRGRGSFPSGHTIAAFSIATVFADRYRNHRWVPWVAYGLASTVGFSRVTLQAHFPSDVFAGAAFGYVISHYVVLRAQR